MTVSNMLTQMFRKNVSEYLIKHFDALKIMSEVFRVVKIKIKSLMWFLKVLKNIMMLFTYIQQQWQCDCKILSIIL